MRGGFGGKGGGGGLGRPRGYKKNEKKMRLKHISYFILQFSSPISRFSGFAVEDFGQFLFVLRCSRIERLSLHSN